MYKRETDLLACPLSLASLSLASLSLSC
jgi:hypothetical protein